MKNNPSSIFKQNTNKNQTFSLFKQSKQNSPFVRNVGSSPLKPTFTQTNPNPIKSIFNNPISNVSDNTGMTNSTKSIFTFPNKQQSQSPNKIFNPMGVGVVGANPPSPTPLGVYNTNMNLINQFNDQLQKRDRKIQILQNQIKILNESMNMMFKYLNQNKNYQVPLQNINPNILKPFQNINPNLNYNLNVGKINQILGVPINMSGSQIIFQDKQYFIHIKNTNNLFQVNNLKLQNQHGKIIFKQTINLSTINIPAHKWVNISDTNVQMFVKQLKNKKFQAFINNFMKYQQCTNATQKQIIVDIVQQAKKNSKFQFVQFDYQTGMLYVRCKGL